LPLNSDGIDDQGREHPNQSIRHDCRVRTKRACTGSAAAWTKGKDRAGNALTPPIRPGGRLLTTLRGAPYLSAEKSLSGKPYGKVNGEGSCTPPAIGAREKALTGLLPEHEEQCRAERD
jgi:hypothetical protein